jgi:hypothetical protein
MIFVWKKIEIFYWLIYDIFGEDLREETPRIRETLEWLDSQNIGYELTGLFSDSGLLSGYSGVYYIDIPFNTTNDNYQKLEEYFEDGVGNMKVDNKIFMYVTLEFCTEKWNKYKIESELIDLGDDCRDGQITKEEYDKRAKELGVSKEEAQRYFDWEW